jgi:hypothetical protein
VSIIKEILERKSSGSGLERREYVLVLTAQHTAKVGTNFADKQRISYKEQTSFIGLRLALKDFPLT